MVKLCGCGCGNPAPIAKRNHSSWGWVKGQPMRFLRGHGNLGGESRLSGPEYLVDTVTGCWVWQHYKDRKGYGVIKRKGKNYQAHRHIYELHHGKIQEGMQLDHLCRNTSCVNPDHLEVVTGAENTRRGMNAKLTPKQVDEIRARFGSGEKQARLAREYNVSTGCINAIVKEKSWT